MKYLFLTFAIWFVGCVDLRLLDDMVQVEQGTDDLTGDTDSVSNFGWFGEIGGDPPLADPDDETAPGIVSLTCDAGETGLSGVCVVSGVGVAAVRLLTDEPSKIAVAWDGRLLRFSPDYVTAHGFLVGDLSTNGQIVEVSLEDASGNRADHEFELAGLEGEPVAVTEVLADPHGGEPTQEFVELANYGDVDMDLSGWMIDDNGDANGDLLPSGTVLAAGGVLLIVGPNFDEADGLDPVPYPGTQLVRLDSSIGSSGLKNSEPETVQLYDAPGGLVSEFSSSVTAAEGLSLQRLAAALPDGCGWGVVLSDDGPTPGIARFWD